MHHLYDTDGFSDNPDSGYLGHNLMRINVFGAKSALFETVQMLVTYNTLLSRNAKKTSFLMAEFAVAGTP